jgi:hypothetical protein
MLPAPVRLFGECHGVIAVDTHHFAGGAHFGAQDRVDALEPREREDRFPSRPRGPASDFSLKEASGSPFMMRAAIPAIGLPITLATNGTVRDARGLTSRM